MKNYSRQREAILEVLRSTDTHPTASWIYERVREKIPNISLGTVYRNLTVLSENGDILTINVGDGQERYDGNMAAHLHLRCTGCGEIYDAFLKSDPFRDLISKEGFIPEAAVYVVRGICKNCK